MPLPDYQDMRRVLYSIGDDSFAQFVPICEKCGRIVKADESIQTNEITGLKNEPNATCSKCGRIQMIFEGFI